MRDIVALTPLLLFNQQSEVEDLISGIDVFPKSNLDICNLLLSDISHSVKQYTEKYLAFMANQGNGSVIFTISCAADLENCNEDCLLPVIRSITSINSHIAEFRQCSDQGIFSSSAGSSSYPVAFPFGRCLIASAT